MLPTVKKPHKCYLLSGIFSVFIARQHVMHADRDIILANPSVRLSVRHALLVYLNKCTCH